jgi:hypothetical protein
MSSSNSSDAVEYQTIMALSCTMEYVMGMLVVEVAGSSSAPRLKRCRHYNRDCEAIYLRLHHNYFDDDCVYSRHTSVEGTVCGEVFS